MKTLLKNITVDKYNINCEDINFEFNVVERNKLLDYIEKSDLLIIFKAFTEVKDIKEFNDRDKLILQLFISKYVNLNPIISSFSKFFDFLKQPIQMLNKKTLSRGYYVANDIFIKANINLHYSKILNVSTIPTFLESYLTICKNNLINPDFIYIRSIKSSALSQSSQSSLSSQTIKSIYTNILNKFKETYGQINFIENLNFYESAIQSIASTNLQKKYELIIFDTYKNIIEFNDSTNMTNELNELNELTELTKLDTNNINRLISAIIHNESLLCQIIFAINKLEIGGDLILLFSGFDNIFNNQLLIILGLLFDNLVLINSDKDYSFRYYIVCKKFNNNINFIEKITNLYSNFIANKNKSGNVLINLFNLSTIKKLTHIPQLSISNNLIDKFNTINNKIIKLTEFIDNKDLILKLYNNTYFVQLLNSYLTLEKIFEINKINKFVFEELNKYKIKVFDKLLIPYNYNFNIDSLNVTKFKFIFEIISDDQFNQLFNSINYLKLFNLVIYDDTYDNNTFLQIQNKSNIFSKEVDQKPYLKELNKYLAKFDMSLNVENDIDNFNAFLSFNVLKNCIDKKSEYLIFKFCLDDLSPFFVSLIYILSNIYKKIEIIKLESLPSVFFVVFVSLNEKNILESNINKIIDKYDNEINVGIKKKLYLVQIDDSFLNTFNQIISKFILKEIMLSVRYKFIYIGGSFTDSFYSFIKQSLVSKQKIKEWQTKFLFNAK